MTTTNTELVERMARAMLADEIQGTNRDFDQVWADEGPVWLKNAAAALEVVRPMLEEPRKVLCRACGGNGCHAHGCYPATMCNSCGGKGFVFSRRPERWG
jgi:hypothetical protein